MAERKESASTDSLSSTSRQNDADGSTRSQSKGVAQSWPQMLRAWPYCTFLIVICEFCKRFGNVSTIFGLYLLNVLKFSAAQTTIFLNVYHIIGGIVPLFGSALADGYIGKFRAILYGTLIYGVGKVIMTSAAFAPYGSGTHPWVDYIGTAIIIVGQSGILPCVASFGGDQFEPHQERMISVYFTIYYFSINAGALVSSFLMPILRAKPCLGQDSCYPLPFAVSAGGMIIASAIFFMGSKWYNKQPPKGNVFSDVYHTTKIALANKRCSPKVEREHWLEHYLDTHECSQHKKCMRMKRKKGDDKFCERVKLIGDIRALLRIIVMYLPLPMFWALYNQQYSVWLIQAISMDCRLWGDVLLLPDMMQFVNPALTMLFIVMFQSAIYPVVEKCVKLTPLRKMVGGGVLASIAFLVSTAVQLKVDATLPDLPDSNHAFVSFVNTFDNCTLNVTNAAREGDWRLVGANSALVNNKVLRKRELFEVPIGQKASWRIAYDGAECQGEEQLPTEVEFEFRDGKSVSFVAIGRNGAFLAPTDTAKPTGGTGEFSVSLNIALDDATYAGELAFCRHAKNGGQQQGHECNPQKAEDFYAFKAADVRAQSPYTQSNGESAVHGTATLYAYKSVRPGSWRLYYVNNNATRADELDATYTGVEVDMVEQGGVYAILLTGAKERPEKRVFPVVPPNTISILWQVPQIAIITAAEVMFSVTGYEFAYTQAGTSMKSIVQSLWFITIASGDLVIILVTLMDFGNLALQQFAYAVVMLIVMSIFALMCIFYYEYRQVDNDDCEGEEEEGPELVEKKVDGIELGNAKMERSGLKSRAHARNGGEP